MAAHALRKRLKFMRSLLQLIRHGLQAGEFKAANDRLRQAGHALAGARRAAALQEAVAKLDGDVAELAAIAAAQQR